MGGGNGSAARPGRASNAGRARNAGRAPPLSGVSALDRAPSLGQRRTNQRDAIAQALREAPGPLTVAELHERARHHAPKLGVATVYRTVNALVEAGELQPVTLPDGQTRYESASLRHHHHFHCRRCQRVFDLHGCAMAISDHSHLPGGFHVEAHEVTLHGLCPDCHRMDAGSNARHRR